MWFALSDTSKRGGGWESGHFFRTGEEEIAAVLRRAEQLGVAPRPGRALDFGCGVGRLTQALARRFERCDGVDIARAMLEKAKRHNLHPERCHYHLNTSPDLSLFGDGSFDFVYTTLVLQHMEPRYARSYIRELIRVLARDGLLTFQLPTWIPGRAMSGTELPASARRTRCLRPLLEGGFRAHITPAVKQIEASSGESLCVSASVENVGTQVWPASARRDGRYQIRLAIRWLNTAERSLLHGRCDLPFDLGPGEKADLIVAIQVPSRPGSYSFEFDMIQEGVSWFQERGSEPACVPCEVVASSGDAATPEFEAVSPDLEPNPPAFASMRRRLRCTIFGRVYRAWRKELAWWRSKRHNRARGAAMEMYSLPVEEITALVEQTGARVVETEECRLPGEIRNCRYWVVRTG